MLVHSFPLKTGTEVTRRSYAANSHRNRFIPMSEAVASAGISPPVIQSGYAWKLSAQKYLSSAVWRIGGAGTGAIGAILAARWLGPEKLGISGVVQSLLLTAILFVTLGQDISLVRSYRTEADSKKRDDLVNDVFWGRLLTSLLLGVLLFAVEFFGDHDHKFLIAACAGFVLLVLQATSPTWIFQATDDVPAQQRFVALQAGLVTVMIVILLVPFPVAGMDMIAQALAGAAAWFLTWRYAWRRHTISVCTRGRWKNYLVRSFSHHWLILSAVVIYTYVSFQQLLIASLCSVSELGLYRPALQVVQAVYPFLALIPAILYPRLIDWAKEGPHVLFRRQLQLMLAFSLLLIPAVAAAFFVLPWLFPKVFGQAFAGGALPCAILLSSKGIVVLNSLFTWGLWAQQRDKSMLAITSAVALLSLGFNLVLIPHYGAIAASSVACLSEFGVLAGSMSLSWWNLKRTNPV